MAKVKEKQKVEKSRAKIIETAKKLKALAERGIVGEKQSAEKLYKEFVAKHNIEELDINPEHHKRTFRLKSRDYEILLSHIILAVNPYISIDKRKGQYMVVLDDADYIEVVERVDCFHEAFKKEKELFFMAFMERFSSSFLADEQSVAKHSQVFKKMQEDAQNLYNKNNPDTEPKTESDPSSRISDEILNAKQPEPFILTNRGRLKMENYKKMFDGIRYVKANRRIGSGKL